MKNIFLKKIKEKQTKIPLNFKDAYIHYATILKNKDRPSKPLD